ncbi:sulfotransferase domain-containing protein [Novosphingobium sp. BL-8H]|uniref:sulfotransferase domain-containing protein n=1 Tax=Novosphingobium sp. BL-8H TaxID=3127640 RepID=UPI003756857D
MRPLRLHAAARAADAFLVSYPKSGRTWLRYILSHYFNLTRDLAVKVDLHSTFAILPNLALDSARGVPGFHHTGTVPLVPVTHLAYEDRLFGKAPIIFLLRDPRDVLVSSYFHATKHKHRFSGSIEDFLDCHQGLPDLSTYLNSWSRGLAKHPHISISYEALMRDTVAVVAEVLRFLGEAVDFDALGVAVRRSDFEAMRRGEMETGIPGHEYDRLDDEALRMRRGKVGGYRDYLSDQAVQHINTRLSLALEPETKSLLRQTGLFLTDRPEAPADKASPVGPKRRPDASALC